MSRDIFIEKAIAKGKSGEEINASLGRLKYDPLSRAEVQQINEGTYGLNFGQRFAKNIGDITKGGAKMVLVEPRAFSESQQIADNLKRKNSVTFITKGFRLYRNKS
mgnify:CR=1 FL=1